MPGQKIPWKAPQVDPLTLPQIDNPGQEIPYSPEAIDQRAAITTGNERLQSLYSQQAEAQGPPSGIEGFINSPIFQLAAPTALSALAAIFPRTMGPAAGIGMAGLRGVTDVTQQNIQNKRSTVAERIKQMKEDVSKQTLKYDIDGKVQDPALKMSLNHMVDDDAGAGAAAFKAVAEDSARKSAIGAENAAFDKQTLGPGESASVGPSGVTRNFNPIEPKTLAPQPPPSNLNEAWLAAFRAEKGREPNMQELDAERRRQAQANDVMVGGLHPKIATMVENRQNKFRSEPVVKRVQTQAEAVDFVNHLDPNSQSPADDQALIYSFAKAMDPDSVVREGEYAVVQKYSQSWLERFGFSAKRVVENGEFLTPQAREMMKAAIRVKYAAGRRQYDNLKKGYANQINILTRGQDGEQYLLSYEDAFPTTEAPAAEQPDPQGRPPLSSFVRP